MRIAKIINNNIVSTCDEEGRETTAMGRGAGFRAKKGNTIGEKKVEKIFRLKSQNTMGKFKELLENFPMGHVQISAEVTGYAKRVLSRPTNPSVYITPANHTSFALEWHKQRMMSSNPLIREVCNLCHAEYLVGKYATAMIERDLGVKLPVDEAVSVTPYTVNVEYDASMGGIIKVTDLIQQVLEVIREYFSVELDEQFLNYGRSITYPHSLAQRVFAGEYMNLDNLELQEVTDHLYPEERACSRKIQAFIKLQHRYQATEKEVAYLALHIKRIRTKQSPWQIPWGM